MGMMIFSILFGAALLYLGAELLVRSAVQIATYFNIPRLVIGLTVIAFATSAPEAIASVIGQIRGVTGDIALGNVIGSNIANVGLVLGIYFLLRPCDVSKELKWQKMPLLFFIYLLVFLIMLGGKITLLEGSFLLFVMIVYIALQYYLPEKKAAIEEEIKVHEESKKKPKTIVFQVCSILGSAVLLVFGSRFLVDGAIEMGTSFGLSERVIGISVVAIGTSLPEVATAIVAAFRKEEEIIVGTVLGSNIFNPLLTLFCATTVKTIKFSSSMIFIDFPLMVAFSILLWVLMILGKSRLSRLDGSILLVSYLFYVIFLFL